MFRLDQVVVVEEAEVLAGRGGNARVGRAGPAASGLELDTPHLEGEIRRHLRRLPAVVDQHHLEPAPGRSRQAGQGFGEEFGAILGAHDHRNPRTFVDLQQLGPPTQPGDHGRQAAQAEILRREAPVGFGRHHRGR